MNDLFGAGTTDGDKLRFVETLRGKLAESETLSQQASQNTKEQFANSPDLDAGIMSAGMEADAAFQALTRQFLASATLRTESKHLLLGPGSLYETLRDRPNAVSATSEPRNLLRPINKVGETHRHVALDAAPQVMHRQNPLKGSLSVRSSEVAMA